MKKITISCRYTFLSHILSFCGCLISARPDFGRVNTDCLSNEPFRLWPLSYEGVFQRAAGLISVMN